MTANADLSQFPMGTRQILTKAFQVMFSSMWKTAPVFAVGYLLILSYFFLNPIPLASHTWTTGQIVFSIAFILMGILFNAVMIDIANSLLTEQKMHLVQSFLKSIMRFPMIFIANVFIAGFVSLGLMLLFVPGFIMAFLCCLTIPFIVIAGRGPLHSIFDSVRFVYRHLWHVSMIWVALFFIGWVINYFLSVLNVHFQTAGDFISWGIVYFFFATLYLPCVMVTLYRDLHARNPELPD